MTSSSANEVTHAPEGSGARWINPWIIVVLLISIYVALAVENITSSSATADELVHLSSGWTALTWGDYRLNSEHPPLAKMLAAAAVSSWLPEESPSSRPVAPPGSGISWNAARATWSAAATGGAAQWYFAHYFAYPLHDSYLAAIGIQDPASVPADRTTPEQAWLWDVQPELVRARMVMLVFPLALILALFLSGRETVGATAGIIAAAFLALDPSFIAHGGLVTTDVPAAASIFFAVWAMRRWTEAPHPAAALALAAATGLAFTIKFSAVVLAPLLALLAAGFVLRNPSRRTLGRALLGLVVAGCGAFVLIWAVYGFRWTASADPSPIPLQTERLVQRRAAVDQILGHGAQATHELIEKETGSAPLSTADRLLLTLHRSRLLPEGWTHGFAFLRAFAAPRNAFLDGRISDRGFADYFIRTFLYKSPPALLLSCALLLFMIAMRRIAGASLWWWGVPLVFLFLLASISRVNIGHRHILMIYPFVWLLCAESFVSLHRSRPRTAALAGAVIALWGVLAPLAVLSPRYGVQPMRAHHLAYFNEIAGGPLGGRNHLVDSNLDWGQDILRFAGWWHQQPDRPVIAWAVTGGMDPRRIGVPVINTALGYSFAPQGDLRQLGPESLLAVSVTSRSGILDNPGTRRHFAAFLREWVVVDRVGYTIDIYARPGSIRTLPPVPPR